MAQVSVNIKLDEALTRESRALFESMGYSLDAAVELFLRQAVFEQAIPFRVGEHMPNAETVKAIVDARAGVGLSRGFSSVTELMKELDE